MKFTVHSTVQLFSTMELLDLGIILIIQLQQEIISQEIDKIPIGKLGMLTLCIHNVMSPGVYTLYIHMYI